MEKQISKISTDERIFKLPKMAYVHSYTGTCYAIFRVGKKLKAIPYIKGYIKHMERLQDTPNADVSRLEYNRIVYGSEDVYSDCIEYLKGVTINKNSTIAREVLCTASPQFFNGVSERDFTDWVNHNVKWLKDTFQENLRVVYLHLDESSPHLHSLLICKGWNEKRKCHTLQSYKYFDGIEKFRNLQDSYATHMQQKFPILYRGIKGSKAKHQAISRWYGIIQKNNQETDIKTLQAKSANEEMLKTKVKYLDKTLKSKEYHNKLMLDEASKEKDKLEKDKQKIEQELKQLKEQILKQEKSNTKIEVKSKINYSQLIAERKKAKEQEK